MKSHNNKKIRYINVFGQPIQPPKIPKKKAIKKKKVDITSPYFVKQFQKQRLLVLERYKVWVKVTDERIG